jgi:hypothetical protein
MHSWSCTSIVRIVEMDLSLRSTISSGRGGVTRLSVKFRTYRARDPGRTIRMAATLWRGALRWIRLPAPKRAVWMCYQAAVTDTPSGVVGPAGGFLWHALVRSTAHVCSAIICLQSFSRQQGNTFARIKGSQRRYSGRVRFFYDPPIRWGGILLQPHARRIKPWPMER